VNHHVIILFVQQEQNKQITMATTTSTLTLASTNLLTDALSMTHSTTFDGNHTSGMARANLTGTSKVTKLSVLDGDAAVADVTSLEGQYVEITDNHGIKVKYVFADAAGGSVAAEGTRIVAATDLGDNLASAITPVGSIYGGVVVHCADGDNQRAILEKLRVRINHSTGHNGSITAAAVATAADGPQSCTMTNPASDESGVFNIDAVNATWEHIDNTGDAEATTSQHQHELIVPKNKYAAPALLYIRNTHDYHATNNIVYLYYNDVAGSDIMEIRGGQFAYMPVTATKDLYAYTSTTNTIVEYMVIGTES